MENIKQGQIIYGVRSLEYPDIPCHGIVITASCDIAQKKVKNIHFVSMVSLDRWLLDNCVYSLIEIKIKELRRNLEIWMVSVNLDMKVLQIWELDKIKKLFLQENKGQSNYDKYLLLLEFETFLKTELTEQRRADILLKTLSKEKKTRVQQIMSNQITGYYYIPPNETSYLANSKGYVVNLRDVNTIEFSVFAQMVDGYLDCKINKEILKDEILTKLFYLEEEEDYSYTLDSLKSPRIEHLMQAFSAMFTRIGLDDMCRDLQNKIATSVDVDEIR
ncbi:MAG: hypothetical protein JEZ08_05705 [Clostridiales bacterium]|nr:hypothetical protein [Clostridiales bacterium]